MKLINKPYNNFCIYELSSDEEKEFGGKYAVVQGQFSDWAIEHFGCEELLRGIKPEQYKYGGFFKTELEAYYHIKLIEFECELDRTNRIMRGVKEFEPKEINWMV